MSKAKDRGSAVPSDVPPSDIEDALCRIGGVSAARVVVGPNERIAEVHILAGTDRSPKQVVRDVQSVALTSFGIDIDYRTVSVVQLEGDAPRAEAVPAGAIDLTPPADEPAPAPPEAGQRDAQPAAGPERAAMEPTSNGHAPPQPVTTHGRPMLIKVGSEVMGHATEVTVSIAVPGGEVVGTARGPASTGPLLVCRAVTDGLGSLLGDAAVDVDVSRFVEVGANEVAVCVLRTATASGDVTVTGSALVRRDPNDAMARATLAALNRLLTKVGSAHGSEPA